LIKHASIENAIFQIKIYFIGNQSAIQFNKKHKHHEKISKKISTNINLLHCAAAYIAVLYRALLCYAVSAYTIFTFGFHLAFSLDAKKFLKGTNAYQLISILFGSSKLY